MRIIRGTSQLLIIDMQEKVLPAVEDHDRVALRCIRLLKAARRLNIPITLAEQYPSGLGPTVPELQAELDEKAMIFEKLHFSCLGDDALREHLHQHRKQGRGQIVVAGIEAHICVTQTVMDLSDQGFEVYVVTDAVSSRDDDSWDIALERLARCGAEIVDSEMVMFEWLEKSGTPEFKELQALLK